MIIKNTITLFFIFTILVLSNGRSLAENTEKEITSNILLLFKNKSCTGCNLQGANLNRADLANADLSGANLRNATFFLANLTGANLQNSDLRKAKFGGSDISEADFRGANITSASFSGAYKRGATFGEKNQIYNSSMPASDVIKTDDILKTKSTDTIEKKEAESTSQPDIIHSKAALPTNSIGPPLKKIKPISKAVFTRN